MPDSRPSISAFWGRHPRLAGTLNQVFLYTVTFQCAVAIESYLPYSPPPVVDSAPGDGGGSTDGKIERMCKWPDANIGLLVVCLQVPALSKISTKLTRQDHTSWLHPLPLILHCHICDDHLHRRYHPPDLPKPPRHLDTPRHSFRVLHNFI